uniref:Auto-transporter adhesin head GIN domain-containing protein n=1 Tax=Ditylenchus dipsaci TaxID=166011 RepID=A0A915ELR8_9BILA
MSISVIDFNSRWSTLLFLVIIWLNLVLIGGMLMKRAAAGWELSWRNVGRWRRQALFNEHVVVHSMDSNISISKQLMVLSSQSRIELRETHLNSTVWSNTSLLAFDGTSQESVALRTTNTTITELRLNTAHLQAVANGLELNTTTERDGSGQSRLNLALVGNVNVSMTDDSLANPVVLEASQGTMVGGFAQTWENSNVTSTKLSIASVPDQTSNTRQLSVAVVSPHTKCNYGWRVLR